MASTWNKQLQNKLRKLRGKKITELINKYEDAFPPSYRDDYPVEMAVKEARKDA